MTKELLLTSRGLGEEHDAAHDSERHTGLDDGRGPPGPAVLHVQRRAIGGPTRQDASKPPENVVPVRCLWSVWSFRIYSSCCMAVTHSPAMVPR